MWPLLVTSVVALAVVINRSVFYLRQHLNSNAIAREQLLERLRHGKVDELPAQVTESKDPVVQVLLAGVRNRSGVVSEAMLGAAGSTLQQYERGFSTLDTIITLAPLLGLLGTVTGMMSSFGMLGMQELSAPTAITGGIAEALIATAFGLSIAIITLVPYNAFQQTSERLRKELEEYGTRAELLFSHMRAAQ